MRILIEEYQYTLTDKKRQHDLKCILKELGGFENVEGKVSVNYVGYYYSAELKDCVFILPKVLITIDNNKKELAFGEHRPEDIINIDKDSPLSEEQKRFIYEFAVWIYRAIDVYRIKNKKSGIIYYKHIAEMNRGRRRMSNTFLDVLLSLIRFNKDNQNFFFFTLKNQHSGLNKINWTRTISKSQAYVQDDAPVYLNPVNKKRQINFDEELLVIFFSILNYINDKYGFAAEININFPLITKAQFENYIRGLGKVRLHQIKYKYFSDKAIQLWELCYAFFDRSHQISMSSELQDYLLAKDFNIVFEAMIDELVGDKIPLKDKRLRKLKEQPDGKMVDHIFQWQNLTNNEYEDKTVYYIGDSKYYKRGNAIGKESVYKQFTYARNVIQWNLDLFNDGTDEEKLGHVMLRDDVTEGYNVIPNFFISAQQNTLKKDDDIHLTDKKDKYFFSRQFENRLFDRDTFLIAHYDVNFLFIVALYGRNNTSEKESWKKRVRGMFRKEIQDMLKKKFLFYALTPHENVNADEYIRENFQLLLGKVFKPFGDVDAQQYFSLALRNPEALDKPEEQKLKKQIETENDQVIFQLNQAFYVEPCALGSDPRNILPVVQSRPRINVPQRLLTRHYVQNYPEDLFLVGGFREEQKEWMFGQHGGKVDDAYNVRLGIDVEGGLNIKGTRNRQAKFVILYEFDKEDQGVFRAYRVKGYQVRKRDELMKEGYPHPHHDRYYCYVFDEEVDLGAFDIQRIISTDRINYASEIRRSGDVTKKYPEGRPIFLKGSELLRYRIGG